MFDLTGNSQNCNNLHACVREENTAVSHVPRGSSGAVGSYVVIGTRQPVSLVHTPSLSALLIKMNAVP